MVSFSKVLDLFLPPRCVACQDIVTRHASLCASCWDQARFITAPFCKACGLPFEMQPIEGSLCLDCQRCAPPFAAARAVFPYDDFSRHLILAFKHGDRTDLAPALAGWMARTAGDLLPTSDLVVPVPLHWRRLVYRRYNQAALLGRILAQQGNVAFAPQVLKRIRHTPVQGHLSRMARQKNLKGAFQVEGDITGKTILLVDDVLTTGATILGCTQALLRAGAGEVRVITLARVLPTVTNG